jgi:hypothetical protein
MKSALLIARDKLHTDVRTTWNILSLKKLGFQVDAISAISSTKEVQNNSQIYSECNFLKPSRNLALGLFAFLKRGFIFRALILLLLLLLNPLLQVFSKNFSPVVTIKLYIRVLARLLKERKAYDLILAQEIDGGIIGLFAHKICGGKLILDLHETYFSKLDHKSGLSFLLKKPLLKMLFKKTDLQMVVSKGHAEFYKNKGFKINPIVLPNMPFNITVEKKDLSQTHEIKDKIIIISQGSHRILHGIRYVNTDTLIKVWKVAKPQNATLWLMHVNEKGVTPLEFLAQKEELLKSNIIVKNSVIRTEVATELSKCNIGFIGYDKNMLGEGIVKLSSPNKIGEYLNARLVLLANDAIDFVVEIIEEFDCGFIYKNEEELASILSEISSNPQILLQKRANIEKALQKHNYFNYFKEISQILDGQQRLNYVI